MSEREWRIVDARRRDWLREMAPPPAARSAPRRRTLRPADIVRFAAIRRVVAAVRCGQIAPDGFARWREPDPQGSTTMAVPLGPGGNADA